MLPISMPLPPLANVHPPQTAAKDELDQALREVLLAQIDLYFTVKKKDAKARVSKLDSSTVVTKVELYSGETAEEISGQLVRTMGENLRKAGFRQLVIEGNAVQL
jgi:hypothetical protein